MTRGLPASALLLVLALAAGCGRDVPGSEAAAAPESAELRRTSAAAPTPGGAAPATPVSRPVSAADGGADLGQTRPTTADDVDASRRTALVRAAERAAPAVVNISVIRTERARARTTWESFFMAPSTRRRSAGFGSGVIVAASGTVLTNDHVVRGADRMKVTLPDGRDFDAQLVGTDPVTDIAVLRIDGPDLPVAPVGTAEGLMIGEWAVAIGNPFSNYFSDAEPTVTAGVVSAVNRNIVTSSEGEGFYLGMIQTDASINPGNSGGALVNASGEVIGINASIFSRSGGSEGLGFAIPIDRALRVAQDLLDGGEVRRAWVGFDVEAVEADEWGRTRGVRVARVAPGSPADQAAIEAGDRLLRANGRPLAAPLDFEAVLLDLRAGDPLVLDIEGQRRPIRLAASALPSVTAERVTVLQEMQLVSVTPQIRAERGLVSERGALIASLSERLAGQLGLQEGDVFVQVNRIRVGDAEEMAQIFQRLRPGDRIRTYLERDGQYFARDFYWR